MIRFNERRQIFDIVITGLAGILSVCVMLYGVFHFGLNETWPELVLNLFYLTCLVMMWMYFFNRLKPADEYTPYVLTEIWIRPTITYGLVACFLTETKEK